MNIEVDILDIEPGSPKHKELEEIIEKEFDLYSIEWILNSKKFRIQFRVIEEESGGYIDHEVKTKLIDTLLDFSNGNIQFKLKDNKGWHFNFNMYD